MVGGRTVRLLSILAIVCGICGLLLAANAMPMVASESPGADYFGDEGGSQPAEMNPSDSTGERSPEPDEDGYDGSELTDADGADGDADPETGGETERLPESEPVGESGQMDDNLEASGESTLREALFGLTGLVSGTDGLLDGDDLGSAGGDFGDAMAATDEGNEGELGDSGERDEDLGDELEFDDETLSAYESNGIESLGAASADDLEVGDELDGADTEQRDGGNGGERDGMNDGDELNEPGGDAELNEVGDAGERDDESGDSHETDTGDRTADGDSDWSGDDAELGEFDGERIDGEGDEAVGETEVGDGESDEETDDGDGDERTAEEDTEGTDENDEETDDEGGLAALLESIPGLSDDLLLSALVGVLVIAVSYVFYAREDPVGTLLSIPGRIVSGVIRSVVAISHALERAVRALRGVASVAQLPGLIVGAIAGVIGGLERRVNETYASLSPSGGDAGSDSSGTTAEAQISTRERIRRAFDSVVDASSFSRRAVETTPPVDIAHSAKRAGAPRKPVEQITRSFRDVEYGEYDPDSYLEETTTAHERLREALESAGPEDGVSDEPSGDEDDE